MDFDFAQISQMLESMSPEEMANLQETAAAMFGAFGGGGTAPEPEEDEEEEDCDEYEEDYAEYDDGYDEDYGDSLEDDLYGSGTDYNGDCYAEPPRESYAQYTQPQQDAYAPYRNERYRQPATESCPQPQRRPANAGACPPRQQRPPQKMPPEQEPPKKKPPPKAKKDPKPKQESSQKQSNPFEGFGDMGAMFTPELLGKLGTLMGQFNKRDERAELINALKPHLSKRRQKRCEHAIQMMKMMSILPALQGTVLGGK
ncbi:MAG: hypothetical protein LBR73_05295 [Oscillospiraceae bacterium]|jgi:hypothetical protein|nr:hypothetical protein [Oscillospiraceae bacterium]